MAGRNSSSSPALDTVLHTKHHAQAWCTCKWCGGEWNNWEQRRADGVPHQQRRQCTLPCRCSPYASGSLQHKCNLAMSVTHNNRERDCIRTQVVGHNIVCRRVNLAAAVKAAWMSVRFRTMCLYYPYPDAGGHHQAAKRSSTKLVQGGKLAARACAFILEE